MLRITAVIAATGTLLFSVFRGGETSWAASSGQEILDIPSSILPGEQFTIEAPGDGRFSASDGLDTTTGTVNYVEDGTTVTIDDPIGISDDGLIPLFGMCWKTKSP